MLAATTVNAGVLVVGLVVVYLLLDGIVAEYGRSRGFPWWPLFISGAFLGFPLVLLAVTVAGPRGVGKGDLG